MQNTALLLLLFLLACTSGACKSDPARPADAPPQVVVADTIIPTDTVFALKRDIAPEASPIDDAAEMPEAGAPPAPGASAPRPAIRPVAAARPDKFTDVAQLEPGIRLDIRYATANNFTKKKIYDCPRCLLRPAVAQALVKAHRALQAKGYGLKVYDCYRPRPYQQRLWDAVPDPNYVTPPARGSMHSRGAAVDLTVVDAAGKELDMGTPYDFFGREAHTDYTGHSARVQANRNLLNDAMRAAGFEGIRTEWWHFSFRGRKYELASYVWDCE